MSTVQLRDYQDKGLADIRAAWASGAQNVLYVLPPGGGKTVIFASELLEHKGAACAIAHRRELIGQMSTTLARLGVRHRIIAPDSVIREIVVLHVIATGRSYHDPTAPVGVASVDSLARRTLGDWADRVTLWVTDECFPAGTLVDGRPIESLRVGDLVTAFNEATGGFEQRPVVRLFRNPAPQAMIRVSTEAHHVLYCTPGHPFWTRRGWVVAAQLEPTDEVLIHGMHELRDVDPADRRGAALPVPENRAYFLHQSVRDGASGVPADPCVEPTPQTEAGRRFVPLRADGRFDRPQVSAVAANGAGVLQPGVLESLCVGDVFGDRQQNQPGVCVSPYEDQKPHAGRGHAEEDGGYAPRDRAQPGQTGRQWETGDRRGSGAVRHAGGGGIRASSCDLHRQAKEQPGACADFVQTGFGELRVENSDRGGRSEPLRRSNRIGPQEGPGSGWVGLDRVEVYQRGGAEYPGLGPDDGFVYNIEVEGLHTYVAGGVTVHNCHHLLRANKWGKALAMFPNARGLGVSGTPERADGKGLGRHADGVFDTMIVGPYGRELIDQGFLTDYRIYAPESDLHRENLPVSETTGEFAPKALVEATRSSHITGDLVEQYLKIAPGKLGVTFTVSVDLAVETAARYRAAGVAAEAVSAQTPELVRASILRRFAKREIMQLVNVGLFGEGFDLPAIEVVSDGAATQSYANYAQRFGRMGRPMAGKERGLFIDHVGNVVHHATRRGLPDSYQTWTLDRREKRSRATDGPSPVKACPACSAVFERIYRQCPYCGHVPVPAQRSAPEHVDGDLLELDPAVLARLRASAEALRATPAVPYGATPEIRGAIMKRHRDLTATQDLLCDQIALWAGWQQHLGRDDHESYRRFYREFGVDVATAQTLRTADARELSERIEKMLASAGVKRKGEAA